MGEPTQRQGKGRVGEGNLKGGLGAATGQGHYTECYEERGGGDSGAGIGKRHLAWHLKGGRIR